VGEHEDVAGGDPVPLKISIALLLLEPSMYSEMNSSVGAACALPSERTSGTKAISNRTSANGRLRGLSARKDID
jgi:hypothetical protein